MCKNWIKGNDFEKIKLKLCRNMTTMLNLEEKRINAMVREYTKGIRLNLKPVGWNQCRKINSPWAHISLSLMRSGKREMETSEACLSEDDRKVLLAMIVEDNIARADSKNRRINCQIVE
ncbi:hypothetical protein E6O75_ATG03808 [Venturia nashicola]|uniref:Uncharacterized protein n=1 Tax=Venturia nashicola TaxID=86259 RepID=A0A4Z1PBF5_9PEZI|nr:hypothetical protein E6O75_ATG03808 [Venturia nashicola]